jgi:hypothetical protein
MRFVREVMKLHREGSVPMREIARMTGLARSTVRDMVLRFERSDLTWPVPAEISDAELEGRLYGPVDRLVLPKRTRPCPGA